MGPGGAEPAGWMCWVKLWTTTSPTNLSWQWPTSNAWGQQGSVKPLSKWFHFFKPCRHTVRGAGALQDTGRITELSSEARTHSMLLQVSPSEPTREESPPRMRFPRLMVDISQRPQLEGSDPSQSSKPNGANTSRGSWARPGLVPASHPALNWVSGDQMGRRARRQFPPKGLAGRCCSRGSRCLVAMILHATSARRDPNTSSWLGLESWGHLDACDLTRNPGPLDVSHG